MDSNNDAIVLTGVEKTFHRGRAVWPVLRSITLTIRAGDVVGLFGNNGAGKSTLLRIIAGLLWQDDGVCVVHGLDNRNDLLRYRREIGLCGADERSFYGRLSGRQNLRLFGRLHGLEPEVLAEREDHLLRLLVLERHADRPVQTLSTGLRQRLNVARALIHDPPVLLLDEATKAADPSTSDLVRTLVRDYWAGEQRKTVLYVSQDFFGIETLCDRVAILDRGTIIRAGTLEEVLEDPSKTLRQCLRELGQNDS
jgi:ABC-type multidrug transport system ATPase subunit